MRGIVLDGSRNEADLFVGKPGNTNPESYVMENFLCLGGCRQCSSPVQVLSGNTTYIVVKAELKQGTDKFTLYVNPVPGLPEPNSGIVKDELDVGEVVGLGFAFTGVATMDEIR